VRIWEWPGPIAGAWLFAAGCSAAPKAIGTALDAARIACNAVAEARAVELKIPKEEAFQKFCNTRDAIAPWVAAAEHAGAALDAGVVVGVGDAEASE